MQANDDEKTLVDAHVDNEDEFDFDEDEEEDDGMDLDIIPVTESIRLKDHRKTVSAVTVDPAGSRIVSGGRDGTLKMWDFNGMDQRFLPFRTITQEGVSIREAAFSLSGDSFLVASTSAQAKLYDREGNSIEEYSKGDPYLRDMKNTKGHTSALTGLRWHPTDKNNFLTASLDGTVRIWDVNNKRQNLHVIPIKSKERGGKTAITSACYSIDGRFIICGGQDGELRVWNSKSPFLRPTQTKEQAHMSGNIISSINISIDNYSIITRAFDDTLKLWDLRKFTAAVAVVNDLPNLFEETNAIFAPSDRLVVTGVSNKKGERNGKLEFFNKTDLSPVKSHPLGDSVVKTLWHSRINQILTTSNDGDVFVLYDQNASAAGAKLCAGKKAKGKTIDDFGTAVNETSRVILTPHALPMFKDEQLKRTKRQMERMRKDPITSKKPDFPISGHGKGGKLGSSSAQVMIKQVMKNNIRDEDPREAILRHAEAAASDPYWVAPAYKTNQPKPVMTETVYEDELEEARAAKKRRPN
ncbi:hypothetical protein HDU97_004212 [Phlyctochytrium planicorne]|nr:hypothetical protein HDU97_004212 [Phlyctochytrium planicorne]